ncbi:unnamed protein product [Prunus armeniaca]|uniref:Uncharacterized protein n=1 Tax=Prunus armeniaca TaxID=36596 RepID=A0A6J5XPF6_PRUAR|nr:unnamed protein product [Prunus armeniaca]
MTVRMTPPPSRHPAQWRVLRVDTPPHSTARSTLAAPPAVLPRVITPTEHEAREGVSNPPGTTNLVTTDRRNRPL